MRPLERVVRTIEEGDAALAAAALERRGGPAEKPISWLADLGDQPQLRTLGAAILAAGLAGGFPRLTRAGMRMLAAHMLATLVKDAVKARIDRTRPRSRRGGEGHRLTPGGSEAKERTSFPSGHAAGATAMALAFARDFPEHRREALALGSVLSLAQFPRCAHYPLDIAAGAAIGLAAEAAISRLLPRARADGRTPHPASPAAPCPAPPAA